MAPHDPTLVYEWVPGELLSVERSRRADPAALCFQRNQDSFDSGSSGPSGTANCVLSQIDLIPSSHSFASSSSKNEIMPLIAFRYAMTASLSPSGQVENL